MSLSKHSSIVSAFPLYFYDIIVKEYITIINHSDVKYFVKYLHVMVDIYAKLLLCFVSLYRSRASRDLFEMTI